MRSKSVKKNILMMWHAGGKWQQAAALMIEQLLVTLDVNLNYCGQSKNIWTGLLLLTNGFNPIPFYNWNPIYKIITKLKY